MSDLLLDLSGSALARKLVERLHLPVPLPPALHRAEGPWAARPLQGVAVAVGAPRAGRLAAALAGALAEAGAEPAVWGEPAAMEAFRSAGEAFGHPPRPLSLGESDGAAAGAGFGGLVLDASPVADIDGLRAVYDFFHPLVGRLVPSGRAVVLGSPPEQAGSAGAAAAQAALDGFTRSLAKELGRRGATANLLRVEDGAEARLAGPLRFLLSAHSAYVSGQPLRVSAAARALPDAAAWVLPLDGKVALVTGAARGIGAATARRLAAEGAHVVCLDRPADDGPTSQLAREIGGSVLLADVSQADAPGRIAEALEAAHGGVDVVIHNAGVTRDKTLARMTAALWDEALGINLGAVARITERLLDGTLRDGGRLVCLSSVAGLAGNVGQTNYAASKAGLIGLVGHWAASLAARGITANALAPGFIETRLTRAIPVLAREVGRRMNSLGQAGLPADVAEAAVFLSSPGAQGVTGQVLRVCGAMLIGA